MIDRLRIYAWVIDIRTSIIHLPRLADLPCFFLRQSILHLDVGLEYVQVGEKIGLIVVVAGDLVAPVDQRAVGPLPIGES